MKKRIWFVLLTAWLMPAVAMAQSVFDGTWKYDMSTAKYPEKPDVYLLKDGMYHCKSCVPAIDVKADGQDQKVSGDPYCGMMSIKAVDDRTIERTCKKDGKTVATSKTWVSADGNTLQWEFNYRGSTSGESVTGTGHATRVEKGAEGSHAISGSWRIAKMDTISDNGLSVTYKVSGDSLTMTEPTGETYTAKLDGTEAPYKGDPGTTSVSVKKKGPNTIEETDKRDGKVISVTRMTVSADGKTMKIVSEDKLQGTTSEITATKQ